MEIYAVNFYYKCACCNQIVPVGPYYFVDPEIDRYLGSTVHAITKQLIRDIPGQRPTIGIAEREQLDRDASHIFFCADLQKNIISQPATITRTWLHRCRTITHGLLEANVDVGIVHTLIGYRSACLAYDPQADPIVNGRVFGYEDYIVKMAAEATSINTLIDNIRRTPFNKMLDDRLHEQGVTLPDEETPCE